MTVLVRPQAPLTVRWATMLWLLAVCAGVAESVVGVVGAVGDGVAMPAIAAQIAIRALVYGGLFVVIDRYFQHGVRWSRYLLAGLLGTVGLTSLVWEPATWLLDHDLSGLDWSPQFLLLALLRSVHLTALLTALALTFHPETNRWFRNAKAA
ncbi:hypothetical protein GCM10029976_086160 [Kribbella albertanoniae]|uniref:Uncharacterized protein n=1 Tax=Kribbella albertanoniae TaxID=1266829 RepID=A0A4R4PUT0_9ACTN|nr:hypothetical protein [Kribbella albertanoniae]TDC26013.1 hypothetical protein E1261_23290 [Kribbella albertanoniae]